MRLQLVACVDHSINWGGDHLKPLLGWRMRRKRNKAEAITHCLSHDLKYHPDHPGTVWEGTLLGGEGQKWRRLVAALGRLAFTLLWILFHTLLFAVSSISWKAFHVCP